MEHEENSLIKTLESFSADTEEDELLIARRTKVREGNKIKELTKVLFIKATLIRKKKSKLNAVELELGLLAYDTQNKEENLLDNLQK